tara:strand:- start:474 stop:758 length:285 start_codon:yes stop_codon:yes gene_type:complete
MAMIICGKTKCSICGEVLAQGQKLVSTTAFIVDQADPLWKYSDSGMHYDCFQQWPLRVGFVKKYNEALDTIWDCPPRHRMNPDGELVEENPEED